jgi:hypothetical protein
MTSLSSWRSFGWLRERGVTYLRRGRVLARRLIRIVFRNRRILIWLLQMAMFAYRVVRFVIRVIHAA